MQAELPITIVADGQFSKALNPLLSELEMWINFQALKADWYGNENCCLIFDFRLIRTLEEKTQQLTDNWTLAHGFAYHYDSSNLTTVAFIAVEDLIKKGVGIDQGIKARLTAVANIIVRQHGLVALA
jgi:hypothetical protein